MNEKYFVWAFVWFDIALIWLLHHLGVLSFILIRDTSYITFIIIGLYFVTNIYLYMCSIGSNYTKNFARVNFLTDIFSQLGMFGTVIGIIFFLETVFLGVDLNNLQVTQNVMVAITQGFGIALLTTAAGLAATMLTMLKRQVLGYDE